MFYFIMNINSKDQFYEDTLKSGEVALLCVTLNTSLHCLHGDEVQLTLSLMFPLLLSRPPDMSHGMTALGFNQPVSLVSCRPFHNVTPMSVSPVGAQFGFIAEKSLLTDI